MNLKHQNEIEPETDLVLVVLINLTNRNNIRFGFPDESEASKRNRAENRFGLLGMTSCGLTT